MNQIVASGIILARTDFQEADRILTILTKDQGKIRAIARGVRKAKSRLAGGIELFSESQLTYIPGRGELCTLVSARLHIHYGSIVTDINRTMLGYDFLKRINKITEDAVEPEYFNLLSHGMAGLNNLELNIDEVEFWFTMRLLHTTGHAPNLQTDDSGNPLSAETHYVFNYEDMSFSPNVDGSFTANHIKLLRLSTHSKSVGILAQVRGSEQLLPEVLTLAKSIQKLSLMI